MASVVEYRKSLHALEIEAKRRLSDFSDVFFSRVESRVSRDDPCKMTSKDWVEFDSEFASFSNGVVDMIRSTYIAAASLGVQQSFQGESVGTIALLNSSAFVKSVVKDARTNITETKNEIKKQIKRMCELSSKVGLARRKKPSQVVGEVAVRVLQNKLLQKLLAGLSVSVYRGASEAQIENYKKIPRRKGVHLAKKWNSKPGACEHCKALDGQEVDIHEEFAYSDLPVYNDLQTTPRHPNCRCVISLVLKRTNPENQ